MRIIAGAWRSRILRSPPTAITRPLPDRVREAMFSMLGSHYETPGQLPPLQAADVFAGSGSAGLEALSRGAARCVFFERNRQALTVLRSNIKALGAEPRSTVVTRSAWAAAGGAGWTPPFDLVLLDPPYRDSEDSTASGPVRRFLGELAAHSAPGVLVVLHHHVKTIYAEDERDGWRMADRRVYGSSVLTLWAR